MKKLPENDPNLASTADVEALLRFKRAEKPDAAFWGRFDAELHQRMLQTLVKKEPWYRQFYYAMLAPKAQLGMAASIALFAVLHIAVADRKPTPATARAAIEPPVAGLADARSSELVAAQLFDLDATFVLAASMEDSLEFTLGAPSRPSAGLTF